MPDQQTAVVRLRDKLITDHLAAAERLARLFAGCRGTAGEDLVQVATAGLITAAGRFDVHGGSDFLSFAVPAIVGEIRRHLRDTSWLERLAELRLEVAQAACELARCQGRAPTPSEIAGHLKIGRDEVLEGL
jgi:RNA polymerase sigma-B factor